MIFELGKVLIENNYDPEALFPTLSRNTLEKIFSKLTSKF